MSALSASQGTPRAANPPEVRAAGGGAPDSTPNSAQPAARDDQDLQERVGALLVAIAKECECSVENLLLGRAIRGHRPLRPRGTLPSGGGIFARVKAAWPIEDVAERLTDLQPAGAGKLRGLCPFHGERDASFYVYPKPDGPEEGRFKCYGCQRGGDVVTLVREAMTTVPGFTL